MKEFIAVCVEDDPDARLLFHHVVTGLGGNLIETSNAVQGLAAIQQHVPQLVLLDLALPGKSGWTVVEGMHADDRLNGIPVLVVSIKDQVEERYEGHQVEWVQDYISKPFEMAKLEASIKQALGL